MAEGMVHYIVVRRDLPWTTTVAQVAHAAGESFFLLGRVEHRLDELLAGEIPAPGSTFGGSSVDRALDANIVGEPEVDGSIPSPRASIRRRDDWDTDNTDPGGGDVVLGGNVSANGPGDKDGDQGSGAVGGPALVAECVRPPGDAGSEVEIDPSRVKVVILGARSEARLERLVRQLQTSGVPFVAIREPDAPWNDQLMAVGLMPGFELGGWVREFHLLPEKS